MNKFILGLVIAIVWGVLVHDIAAGAAFLIGWCLIDIVFNIFRSRN